VPVYGGIILNPAMDKCVLVKGWSKNATWGFPKGKVNKNEGEMACAAREVYEEVGFDASQLINEDDTITATINNNDNEQTIKLYIIAGVPEDTVFETQTRKEISKICWFSVRELPVSSMPGRDFFLVRPFVKQLNEWIKSRKSGKPRAIHSKQQMPKVKESRRTASVPTQRPERQFNAECVRQYSEGHNTLAELGRSGSFSVEDMFRVNEERFGVKSTYQADLYTTPLRTAGNSKPAPKCAKSSDSVPPGGEYRQCTVKDKNVTISGSSSKDCPQTPILNCAPSHRPGEKQVSEIEASHCIISEAASNSRISPPTARKSAVAKHGTGSPPAQVPRASVESKRRKGEPIAQAPKQNDGKLQLQHSQFHSSCDAEVGKTVRGNVEFGKGFRFNTLEVMAPILAMS